MCIRDRPTDIATYVESNEAPPTKSLYDWQREDEFGSVPTNVNAMPSSNQIPLTQEYTKSTRNAFDRDASKSPVKPTADQTNDISRQKSQESAVIVFGYPESISNQIILHFSKFGNILEDLEVLRGVTGNNISLSLIHI